MVTFIDKKGTFPRFMGVFFLKLRSNSQMENITLWTKDKYANPTYTFL